MAARWEGTRIDPGVKDLPVGIAYVNNETSLDNEKLDFKKCAYVAIGISHETKSDKPVAKKQIHYIWNNR